MPQQKIAFEIDDNCDVEDNIAAFIEAIEPVDEALVSVLKPALMSCISGNGFDTVALWNALYASTAPAQTESDGDEVQS